MPLCVHLSHRLNESDNRVISYCASLLFLPDRAQFFEFQKALYVLSPTALSSSPVFQQLLGDGVGNCLVFLSRNHLRMPALISHQVQFPSNLILFLFAIRRQAQSLSLPQPQRWTDGYPTLRNFCHKNRGLPLLPTREMRFDAFPLVSYAVRSRTNSNLPRRFFHASTLPQYPLLPSE